MALDHFMLGVVVARRPLKGPWSSHIWLPVAVLPAAPPVPAWTRLGSAGEDETYYAGAAEVAIHSGATGHYRDNLTAAQPSVWVVLRTVGEEVELVSATVDPYEGEALAESIGDIVEAVPMPFNVRARVQSFVDEFHVEQTFYKRKRDRLDPKARPGGRSTPRRENEE